jgi:arachidonate 15-lipoxygenase
MDDRELLPHYPFRDDGMMLWECINRFVADYLALYYQSPQDLQNDQELQNWARELASKDGGRTAGMPERIETFDQLVRTVAIVIFTCAPLHSALNFAQYEYIGYVPNMPYAAYGEFPENGGLDMPSLMKILPPYDLAAYQLKWTEMLTSYHYDRLGHYDEKFQDPPAQALVERFQRELADIEAQIDRANTGRPVPYKYLKPSEIINSINT